MKKICSFVFLLASLWIGAPLARATLFEDAQKLETQANALREQSYEVTDSFYRRYRDDSGDLVGLSPYQMSDEERSAIDRSNELGSQADRLIQQARFVYELAGNEFLRNGEYLKAANAFSKAQRADLAKEAYAQAQSTKAAETRVSAPAAASVSPPVEIQEGARRLVPGSRRIYQLFEGDRNFVREFARFGPMYEIHTSQEVLILSSAVRRTDSIYYYSSCDALGARVPSDEDWTRISSALVDENGKYNPSLCGLKGECWFAPEPKHSHGGKDYSCLFDSSKGTSGCHYIDGHLGHPSVHCLRIISP